MTELGGAEERDTSGVGVAVLAHTDSPQLRRLLRALHPLPVVVHWDRRSPAGPLRAIEQDAPPGVSFARRYATAWGSLDSVRAELWAMRQLLEHPRVNHVAVVSGSDFPVVSPQGIATVLARYEDRSLVKTFRLPFDRWGPSGGLDRYQRLHWRVGGRDLSLPVSRDLPEGLALAGAAVQKILCRTHIEKIHHVVSRRPEILRRWRRVWLPDETLIASLLLGDGLVCDDPEELVNDLPWYIDWGAGGPSPRWLGRADLPAIRAERDERRAPGRTPLLFLRKVGTGHGDDLVDVLESDWLGLTPGQP
ncbi:MAG: hypothetical protein M0Z33_02045 [Actinomycetota bacterium]|nr:hypothetical protein [Actinomycetota bacterium]